MNLSRTAKIWIGIVAVVLIFGMWLMGSYNNFVGLEENVNTSFANMDTQYQRRYDLIPNLVASVQGTLKQEQDIFGKLAEARTKYTGAGNNIGAKQEAAKELEAGLSRLLVIMENYPNLRSVEAVQSLMIELEASENRVSVARERYNTAVESLNVGTRRFPGNIVAGIFNFEQRQRFEAEVGAKVVPKVDLTVK